MHLTIATLLGKGEMKRANQPYRNVRLDGTSNRWHRVRSCKTHVGTVRRTANLETVGVPCSTAFLSVYSMFN